MCATVSFPSRSKRSPEERNRFRLDSTRVCKGHEARVITTCTSSRWSRKGNGETKPRDAAEESTRRQRRLWPKDNETQPLLAEGQCNATVGHVRRGAID